MMLEYIIIFVIVGWAVWFAGRNLWREVKAGRCSDCYCKEKKNALPILMEKPTSDKNK